jgi:hypothetical protein
MRTLVRRWNKLEKWQKKARMKPFGPRLKTAGFPQLRASLCASSLANSLCRVNTCRLTNCSVSSKKICDIVCTKVEHTANLEPSF